MKKKNFGGAGGLDVWMAGGEDREGGGEGPAIVLCHGAFKGGDRAVLIPTRGSQPPHLDPAAISFC